MEELSKKIGQQEKELKLLHSSKAALLNEKKKKNITKEDYEFHKTIKTNEETKKAYHKHLEKKITEAKKIQQERRERQNYKDKKPVIILAIGLIIILSIIAITNYEGITGFATYTREKTTILDINQTFTENSELELNITNATSLTITGEIIGEGRARVLLEVNGSLLTVMDKQTTKKTGTNIITGLVVGGGETEQPTIETNTTTIETTQQNETEQENITTDVPTQNITETNISITTNVTENISTNITTSPTLNISQEANITESPTLNVSETNITQSPVVNISQETNVTEVPVLNISETNVTTSPTLNISQETNVTEIPIVNITENISINISENITEIPLLNITEANVTTTFKDECVETCIAEIPTGKLIIQLEGVSLRIESIKYKQKIDNKPPFQTKAIENITFYNTYELDASTYFKDPENDTLIYDIKGITAVDTEVKGNKIIFTTNNTGTYETFLYATDGESLVKSNTFTITVGTENITEINQTLVIEENTTQYDAVINQPVKWKKTIKVLANETNETIIRLPEEAKNIKVTEEPSQIEVPTTKISVVENNTRKKLEQYETEKAIKDINKELETASPKTAKELQTELNKLQTKQQNLITGQAITQTKEGILTRLMRKAGEYFKNNQITGRVIQEIPEAKIEKGIIKDEKKEEKKEEKKDKEKNNETTETPINISQNNTTPPTQNITTPPTLNISQEANITTSPTLNISETNITTSPTLNISQEANITTSPTLNISQEANVTTNITTNISTNITTNITENITTNTTTNTSTNITTSPTLNISQEANITESPTLNISETNVTTNITPDINISTNTTINATDNTTINITEIPIVNISEENISTTINETGIDLIIEHNETSYTIEYETEAPRLTEQQINPYKTIITITSYTHYQNILTFTNLTTPAPKENIALYWIQNGTKTRFENVTHIDEDEDGLIDVLEWVTPHLSNQTFEIIITVLNVQSYPLVGGYWTVMLNTSGEANLEIIPYDLTTFWPEPNDYGDLENDLEFQDFLCGNESKKTDVWITTHYTCLNNTLEIDGTTNCYSQDNKTFVNYTELMNTSLSVNITSLYLYNYTCDEISYLQDIVKTPGGHHILFEFGPSNATAHNWAVKNATSVTENATISIRRPSGNLTSITGAYMYLDSTQANTETWHNTTWKYNYSKDCAEEGDYQVYSELLSLGNSNAEKDTTAISEAITMWVNPCQIYGNTYVNCTVHVKSKNTNADKTFGGRLDMLNSNCNITNVSGDQNNYWTSDGQNACTAPECGTYIEFYHAVGTSDNTDQTNFTIQCDDGPDDNTPMMMNISQTCGPSSCGQATSALGGYDDCANPTCTDGYTYIGNDSVESLGGFELMNYEIGILDTFGWSTTTTYNINWDSSQEDCNCYKGAGYWALGGDVNTCCQDDANENKTSRIASATMDNGYATNSSDIACCNAHAKCVDDNACYANASVSQDADSDSDNDYCNAGTWYDCNADAQCGSGYYCSANDCLASSMNVTFVSPTPANGSRQISNSVTINVTVVSVGSNVSSCTLQWQGANETMTKVGSGTSVTCNTTKATTDGVTYTYKVFANNTVGLTSNTTTRSFIENTKPSTNNVVLTSSSGNNYTTDNLTVSMTSTDAETDIITNITDWRVGGTSIAVLNMPFDTNISSTTTGAVKDYSTFGNNGTAYSGSNVCVNEYNELLTNGGMESASGGLATGWSTAKTEPGTMTPSDAESGNIFVGIRSQKIVYTDVGHARFTQGISVPNNTRYHFRATYKASSGGSQNILGVYDKSGGGQGSLFSQALTSDDTWRTMDIYFTTPSDSAGTGYIDVPRVDSLTGTVTIYIDEVSLREVCPTYTTGKVGGAYSFDGTNDYINIPISNSLKVQNTLTLEAWVYPNNYNGDIIILGQSAYYLTVGGSGQLQTYWYGKSNEGYHSTSANAVPTSQWTHIVAVWSETDVKLYINKQLNKTVSNITGSGNNATTRVWIGAEYDGTTRQFNGSIDEVRIYNRSLSAEEITVNYNAGLAGRQPTTLASNETIKGDVWTVAVTPNDKYEDGTTVTSNSLVIVNSAPNITLLTPTNGQTLTSYTNRTPRFTWNGSDADNDSLTYTIWISTNSAFTAINQTSSGLTDQNYTASDVGVDTVYYWKVEAYDSTTRTNSSTFNFTLQSYEAISLVNASVNFSTVNLGYEDNTTDNSPWPLRIMNSGNVYVNLTINASALWVDPVAPLGTNYYRFKADNVTGEAGAFNYSASTTSWTNMSATPISLLKSLDFHDVTDEAEIDLYIKVPLNEPAGGKTSTITISS